MRSRPACAKPPASRKKLRQSKYACDLNCYFGGLPRLPQLPPTGIQRAALEQLMKQLRN